MKSRLRKLRRLLTQKGLDAVLVSSPSNRRYLSGFTGSAGFLLISPDEAILATDFRYTEQAGAQVPGFRIVRAHGELDWFPGTVAEAGLKVIGFESDDLAVTAYRHLVEESRRLAPKRRPRLVPTRGLVESLRAIKDATELRAIRAAAALADAAMAHARRILALGMTEKRLSWEIERFLRERGSESLPFPIIVASGPNAARPHAEPSDRVIGEGEPVVIDLGARLNGYCSDLTRTISLGRPSERMGEVSAIVRKAQSAAIEALAAGMNGAEADRIARTVIESAGYREAFGHGLGHGVGLEVHEEPRLGPKSEDVLAAGMVFTIEPGVYIQGWGGVRIEDMVLLGKKGPSLLTHAERSAALEVGP